MANPLFPLLPQPFGPPSLSMITLGVADLTIATRFYREFGFEQFQFPGEGIAFFQTSRSWIALFPYEELAKDVGPSFKKGALANSFTLAYNVSSEGGR